MRNHIGRFICTSARVLIFACLWSSHALAVSPSGTAILSATGGSSIVDTGGNVWTLVSGVVYENGSTAAYTANVTNLFFANGLIYQENSAGLFWTWVSGNWSLVSTGPSIVDAANNSWTLNVGVVYENGSTAAYSANVIKLLYQNGVIYQENQAGGYWTWTSGNWASSSGPSVVGPSAPGNFQMTGQGENSVSLAWSAATAGSNPIAHYKIYRNGASYTTTTNLTYTDTGATNAAVFNQSLYEVIGPSTIYTYGISAVDTSGTEGPMAAQFTAWVYHNGSYYWTSDFNYSATANYSDTSGGPTDGATDVMITSTNGVGYGTAGGYWQPYSAAPFLTTSGDVYSMDIGAFHYMTIDLKPTQANQTWVINIISRGPTGDIFNTAEVSLPGTFGPTPQVGQWGTYKIPFLPASGSADGTSLQVGTGQYTGSISGTSLNVTNTISGLNVQSASWLTGTGIAAGTYISGPDTGNGGVGNYYTVEPSQTVSSTTISAQRTNMYKFSLQDSSNNSGTNTYYVQRVGFTTN
jgi:hypothetical protein